MTMNASLHPDDERLAEHAEQAEGLRDPRVAAHVAACDRCRALVTDLRSLGAALSALPDVAPSRPLQLIPPLRADVASPAPAGGWLGMLRQFVAPAYALGAILLVVGFVSLGGQPLGATAGGAPVPAAASAAASAAQGPGAPELRNATPAPSPASDVHGYFGSHTTPGPTQAPGKQATGTATGTPDLPVLILGAGLLLVLGASGVLAAGRLAGR
jgi:hypothetical protein